MIARRPRPTRRATQHLALVEAAVADHASMLWERAVAQRLRWLRHVLRQLRPTLERLVRVRAQDLEAILLEQLIRQFGASFPVPDLTGPLAGLERTISLQYGFLPSDPRAKVLEQSFKSMLRADTFRYWQGLTDPAELAKKLAAYREKGQTTAQIIRQVQTDYRAGYFSAERMVRTLYNSGANAAQIEALRAQGYTHKKWLTARDSRVRFPSKGHKYNHRAMEGVMVPLEQPFITPTGSRMMTPGDRSQGAPPGDWINCRCSLVGVIREQPRPSFDDFNTPAPPAKDRLQTWTPQGQFLRQALRFPRRNPYSQNYEVFDLVRETADLVQRVHGTNDLALVYVANRFLEPTVFARYSDTGEHLRIDVQAGKTQIIHVLEEFGHWIDNQAFTPGRYESLHSSDFTSPLASWRKAVKSSQAIAALRSQRRALVTYDANGQIANDRGYVKYLLNFDEVFARSYRQFVATYSGDSRLLKAIGARQNKPGFEIGYNVQWADDDFDPIAVALENVFWRLGWLRR